MKIIVPMAGWGSRLRPHTLTVPKPMLRIAGKSIVERLISNISNTVVDKIEEIAFIIREDFGLEIENELIAIASQYGTKAKICYQTEPLGTGHAILCARESLTGNVVVGFADTMFDADFKIDKDADAVIWVKQISNPEAFGVIKLNEDGVITEFVEKPKDFISDLAIIGIYYFKSGEELQKELQYLIDNNIRDKGEYQLTTAMENMRVKGCKMKPGTVNTWLDCGNKNATVDSNQQVLSGNSKEHSVHPSVVSTNSIIIPPCFIGVDVVLMNTVVGPHVSIGKNTILMNCIVSNSIIQNDTEIVNKSFSNSMIGSKVSMIGRLEDLSIGDYNQLVN
jgi:glucose-1-phosphate thymidylyltransferase